jgi:hypothetical protein
MSALYVGGGFGVLLFLFGCVVWYFMFEFLLFFIELLITGFCVFYDLLECICGHMLFEGVVCWGMGGRCIAGSLGVTCVSCSWGIVLVCRVDLIVLSY